MLVQVVHSEEELLGNGARLGLGELALALYFREHVTPLFIV